MTHQNNPFSNVWNQVSSTVGADERWDIVSDWNNTVISTSDVSDDSETETLVNHTYVPYNIPPPPPPPQTHAATQPAARGSVRRQVPTPTPLQAPHAPAVTRNTTAAPHRSRPRRQSTAQRCEPAYGEWVTLPVVSERRASQGTVRAQQTRAVGDSDTPPPPYIEHAQLPGRTDPAEEWGFARRPRQSRNASRRSSQTAGSTVSRASDGTLRLSLQRRTRLSLLECLIT